MQKDVERFALYNGVVAHDLDKLRYIHQRVLLAVLGLLLSMDFLIRRWKRAS